MDVARTRFTSVAMKLLGGYSPPSHMVLTPMKVRYQSCQVSTAAQGSFAQEMLMIRTTASTKSSEHEETSSPKRPHETESGTSVTALVQGKEENTQIALRL